MDEYIIKETLQAKLNRKKAGPANKRYTEGWNDAILMVKSMIHSEKAANVAPVVRCKDCKHLCVWNRKDMYAFCPKTNIAFLPFEQDTRTFFCGFGERKDGGRLIASRPTQQKEVSYGGSGQKTAENLCGEQHEHEKDRRRGLSAL